MSDPTGNSVQGHLTLTFPMKSPKDCAALREKIPTLVADLYRAADAMGTLHYCRFIALDEVTICMLADFDGELETVLEAIATHLGPVIDPVLAHVSEPPPTPIAGNTQAFVKWASDHHIESFAGYCTYPGATAQKIRSLASAAGIALDRADAQQFPLLVIMPMRSRLSVVALEAAFKVIGSHVYKGADAIGTVHFANLVKFPRNQVGFFTIYDGPWEKYAQDFATQLGPAFDLMFKFVVDPAPTPVSKNVGTFTKWAEAHDWVSLAFYSAYPGLSVQDVRALLAGG
jgi:hypothetical protein